MSAADGWGDLDDGDPTPGIIANLPTLLRGRFVCGYPGVDHGHTDCYFGELAASELDRLRAEVKRMRPVIEAARVYLAEWHAPIHRQWIVLAEALDAYDLAVAALDAGEPAGE